MQAAEEEDKILANLVKDIDNWDKEETPDPTPEEYFDFDPETGGISIKNASSYYKRKENGSGEPSPCGLKTIVIPSTYRGYEVKRIGYPGEDDKGETEYYGFNYISDVEKIVIPDTVTEIKYTYFRSVGGGFAYCTSLKEIRIPKSVTTMRSCVFDGCTSLEKVYVPFKEGEMPSGWDSKWNKGCNAEIIYQDS